MQRAVPLSATQESRLRQFGCLRTVDVHCHLLPGVDDGPPRVGDALGVARALVEDGFTDVIATPHMLGRWDGTNHPEAIRAAVADLQPQLLAAGIPLTVHPGGEVRLDERIPKLIGSGAVITLADQGVHLLLELPLGFNIAPAMLVPFLSGTGTRIVLAHAERYQSFVADLRTAEGWVKQGVALQINATSLLTDDAPAKAAWEWMARGWVSLIATDTHSTNTRRPRMTEAVAAIVDRLGPEVAKRVCIENPLRVLEGKELLPAIIPA